MVQGSRTSPRRRFHSPELHRSGDFLLTRDRDFRRSPELLVSILYLGQYTESQEWISYLQGLGIHEQNVLSMMVSLMPGDPKSRPLLALCC